MRILYVEDNRTDADLTVRELAREAPHLQVDAVDRVGLARQRLGLSRNEDRGPRIEDRGSPSSRSSILDPRSSAYDLLLADLNLPDGDGLTLLAEVRRRGLPLAVVIVTGTGDADKAVAALKAGADDYVVKSNQYPAGLAAILRSALEQHRREAKRKARLLRVLYVEHNPHDVLLTKRHLAEHAPHIQLEMLASGEQLLSRLASGATADVVLLDYSLPDLNALEVTKELRQVRGLHLPIVVVTGQGSEEVALQAIKLGAADYVTKAPGYLYRLPFVLENAFHQALAAQEAEALRLSEARLAGIIGSALNAILVADAAGHVVLFNAAAERTFRCPAADAVGQPVERFLPGYVARSAGQGLSPPQRGRRADGVEFPLEASFSAVEVHGQPLCTLILRDVSEKKRLEEQLLQAQKLDSVGRLAAGVAHDFNNLLTCILGHSHLASTALPKESPVQENLRAVREAADRSAELTQHLLTFARQHSLAPVPTDLNALVRRLERILRRLLEATIDLEVCLADGLGAVRIDPGKMEQVLLNLVLNARDAMPHGGRLTISTSAVAREEGHAPLVRLTVRDTGVGMTEEVKQRLFEPFFTTKPVGQGTGLGLAICYGVVKQLGGFIEVESRPGRGSAFHIHLPCCAQSAAAEPAPEESPALPPGRETVLIVEDDPLLRSLAAETLRLHGYTPLEASDGEEGLEVARTYPGEIHLLLTDMILPRLGGQHLGARLRAVRPGVRVLYVSGYPEEAALRTRLRQNGVGFLQKPFTPASLANKVRELLDAPPVQGMTNDP